MTWKRWFGCCSLMKPDAEASLHIGLGIGMTAKAFAEHGLRTDVIELHSEVGHRQGHRLHSLTVRIALEFRFAEQGLRTDVIELTGAGAGEKTLRLEGHRPR